MLPVKCIYLSFSHIGRGFWKSQRIPYKLKLSFAFFSIFIADSEAAKLQKHLNLLRQEYVKLQNKTLDLEQKLAAVSATSGNVSEDTYASQLLKLSNDLHDKETYT